MLDHGGDAVGRVDRFQSEAKAYTPGSQLVAGMYRCRTSFEPFASDSYAASGKSSTSWPSRVTWKINRAFATGFPEFPMLAETYKNWILSAEGTGSTLVASIRTGARAIGASGSGAATVSPLRDGKIGSRPARIGHRHLHRCRVLRARLGRHPHGEPE